MGGARGGGAARLFLDGRADVAGGEIVCGCEGCVVVVGDLVVGGDVDGGDVRVSGAVAAVALAVTVGTFLLGPVRNNGERRKVLRVGKLLVPGGMDGQIHGRIDRVYVPRFVGTAFRRAAKSSSGPLLSVAT